MKAKKKWYSYAIFIFYIVCFEAKCFLYYIFLFAFLAVSETFPSTSMSIPAPTKLSDPQLKLHPPRQTHPV
jgi:hypothetical protein